MARQASDRPRVRVAALIEMDGRVVLARHAAGSARYHLLPGGGVGFGETMGDALRREVREETGLQVSVGDPVLVSDTIDPSGSRHIINITFACEVTGGAIGEPEDPRVEAVDLVLPSELASMDLRPPMAEAVIGVLSAPQRNGAKYLGSLYTPEKRTPDVT